MNFKMPIRKGEVPSPQSAAMRLLVALRAAGSEVFILPEDDGAGDRLIVSPPLRHVEWDEDVEASIDHHYEAIKGIVR